MMRLVDDDQIELAFDEALGVFASARRGDRSNDAILPPERLRILAQQRLVAGGEVESEFCL